MPRPPAFSIRQQLLLIVVLTVLAVLAVHDGAAYVEVRQSALDGAEARLIGAAERVGGMFETNMGQARRQTRALARDTAVQAVLRGSRDDRVREEAHARLRSLAASSDWVMSASVWDSTGREILGTAPAPAGPNALAPRDVIALVRNPDSTVTGPLIALGDTLAYPVIAGVRHGRGTLGYVVAWRRVAGGDVGHQQTIALVGSEALLYLGNTDGPVWTDFVGPVPPPPIHLPGAGPVEYEGADGARQLGVVRPIAETPWTLVVEAPRANALAPMHAMLRRLAVLTALLLTAGGLVAWLLASRLTTPLGELADAAATISAGDYTRRVAVRRRDEVGALGAAFNAMAESVAAARDRLEAHTREIEDQASKLADQASELELANEELSDAVEEAMRSRDALDAVVAAHARVAAELDAALGSAPVGFAFYDATLRFRRVNEALAALSGVAAEAHRGRSIADVVPAVAAEIEEHLRHVLATGESVLDVEFAAEMPGQPGVVRHWLSSYYPIRTADGTLLGVGSVVSDRTAYRALEEQFRQAQKMEAIGRLAGGVAHDFNNVLTAIRNYSQFLLEDLGPGDPRADDVGEIGKAADRAAALVRQLLAFSRQQVLQPRALDLNATVGDLAPMLGRLIGAQVQLDTRLDPALGVVRADPGQVEQILVNLVVNAQDAMPDGGTLLIETANVDLDAEYARQHADCMPGPYVMLAVTDTGVGMSSRIQARIFEPFFTTKDAGKGTGLGLATVYGIVKQSGGHIWVYSEPGSGTAIKIYLPRVDGDAVEVADDDAERPAAPRGVETILLVEDDAAVRAAARRTLTRAGYTVVEAVNGTEALALYSNSASPIDLVVTDLAMPEMGGRDLAARLRAHHHGARVLYMSGFTHDAVMRQSVLAPGDIFLEKPFTPDALARKVREVLGPSSTDARAGRH